MSSGPWRAVEVVPARVRTVMSVRFELDHQHAIVCRSASLEISCRAPVIEFTSETTRVLAAFRKQPAADGGGWMEHYEQLVAVIGQGIISVLRSGSLFSLHVERVKHAQRYTIPWPPEGAVLASIGAEDQGAGESNPV